MRELCFFAARDIEVPGAWVFKVDLAILLKGLFLILFARFSMWFFQLTYILDCFRLKCTLLAATDVVATRVTRSQNSSAFVSVTPRLASTRCMFILSYTFFWCAFPTCVFNGHLLGKNLTFHLTTDATFTFTPLNCSFGSRVDFIL